MTELRELDKRLAEWMGYAEVQEGHMSYWYTPTDCGWQAYPGPCNVTEDDKQRPEFVYHDNPKAGLQGWEEVPHFSADIAAAFQVVEFVRAKGCFFDLSEKYVGWQPVWEAAFTSHIARRDFIGTCATIPEAICRAAVAVMDAENIGSRNDCGTGA